MNRQEIIDALKAGTFTLTDVIDAVVEVNGIIGVGLVTLGEQLNEYPATPATPLPTFPLRPVAVSQCPRPQLRAL